MKRFLGIVFWMVCFVLPIQAANAVPQILHYNAFLTNEVGEAVDCPDAVQCGEVFDLTFRLYESESSSVMIWEETYNQLSIYKGSFHVVLGSLTPITAELLNGPTWLSIKVNDLPEMEPRQQVASSAYAIRSGRSTEADLAINANQLGGVDADEYATQESLSEIQTSLAAVATEGLPEDLADGDNDALGALICGEGMVPKVTATGVWGCGNDNAGEADTDTQLSEDQVDTMVANNGYAAQSAVADLQASLATLQTALTNTQESLTTLQGNLDSVGVTINNHGLSITALETNLSLLQSNITSIQSNLEAEVSLRENADLILQQAITDESVQRIADDGALQVQLDTLQGNLNNTLSGLAAVATSGSYNDLSDTPVDSDSLLALDCEAGQVAKWDGASWSCGDDIDTDTTIADTNTQLTEAEVDAFVANNGYLTSYTDTNTQLTEAEVDAFVANNGYLTSYTDTNTQLTEAEVDAFVANNGYVTAEALESTIGAKPFIARSTNGATTSGSWTTVSTLYPLTEANHLTPTEIRTYAKQSYHGCSAYSRYKLIYADGTSYASGGASTNSTSWNLLETSSIPVHAGMRGSVVRIEAQAYANCHVAYSRIDVTGFETAHTGLTETKPFIARSTNGATTSGSWTTVSTLYPLTEANHLTPTEIRTYAKQSYHGCSAYSRYKLIYADGTSYASGGASTNSTSWNLLETSSIPVHAGMRGSVVRIEAQAYANCHVAYSRIDVTGFETSP